MKIKSISPRFIPLSLLLLSVTLPFSMGVRAADSEPIPSEEPKLPPARVVIDRFIKEIGGKAALDKIDSQHALGKFELGGQGITGELEVFAKRPNKLFIKISLPGVGEMLQGFDGKVGWSQNPVTGPMVLEGKMLDQLREQADFNAVLHDSREYKSMQTVAKPNFEGRDCYQLKLVRNSGDESTEYYDVQTGLLIGSSEVKDTPLGTVAVTAVVSEYKKFGDILYATKLTEKMGPLAQVMNFSTMEFNKVDDSVFELPDQIKALAKPEGAAPARPSSAPPKQSR